MSRASTAHESGSTTEAHLWISAAYGLSRRARQLEQLNRVGHYVQPRGGDGPDVDRPLTREEMDALADALVRKYATGGAALPYA